MATITDDDLKMFQERAKTEFASRCDTGGIAWDSVIWDLCNEVRKLRSVSKEHGDCAKLREALEHMVRAETYGSMERDDLCGRCLEKMFARCKHDGTCWVDKAITALSAPPRNCDRFATVDEARKAHEAICEKYGKCHNGCPLNNEEHYSAFDCFEAWLFAPATEREGGNDADK